jgi:hypothetical protein
MSDEIMKFTSLFTPLKRSEYLFSISSLLSKCVLMSHHDVDTCSFVVRTNYFTLLTSSNDMLTSLNILHMLYILLESLKTLKILCS